MTRLVRVLLVTVAALALLADSVDAQARKKARACQTSLDTCPVHGCEPAGTPHALMNQLKRTLPKGDTPTVLTLDDFETLQQEADDRLPKSQKVDLTKQARAKLQGINVPSGATVGEGTFAEVQGYIVGLPNHPAANKSGESVNCRLKGVANNDFHIPIARRWTHNEYQGVVVEMIPQGRPDGWTLNRLHAVGEQGRQVRVRGSLFYDNEHFVNDDEENPKGSEPKRFSLWEIHPITEFLVCKTAKKVCDAADGSVWQKIEEADGLE
jgi:hypothetical protein